jgi:hypothetical protein
MKKLLVFLCILAICGTATLAAAECETRGVGYWNTHYADSPINYGDDAYGISVEIVNELKAIPDLIDPSFELFESTGNMLYFLQKKGRKTVIEHTKRQMAALLLNIVNCGGRATAQATSLNTGELELFDQLNGGTEETAKVENAIVDIHLAVESFDETDVVSKALTEIAKDLADELNNRGAF